MSKSNKANVDDIMRLNHDLIKLGDTVIQFSGSGADYDPHIMDTANRVIAVHPAGLPFSPERCNMGRGQFNEHDYAVKILEIPFYVYHENMIYPVKETTRIPGKDSWADYAYFYLGDPQILNPAREINKGLL